MISIASKYGDILPDEFAEEFVWLPFQLQAPVSLSTLSVNLSLHVSLEIND